MQEYANIITQSPRTPTLPDKIPGTHNPDWDKLLAVGWRKLDARAEWVLVDGKQLIGWEYRLDAERADYATESPVVIDVPTSAEMAAAAEKAKQEELAALDASVSKLPSVAAIVADANSLRAENADLRKKLDAAEAKLATVQATADKAAADVAALKEVPKPVEPVK